MNSKLHDGIFQRTLKSSAAILFGSLSVFVAIASYAPTLVLLNKHPGIFFLFGLSCSIIMGPITATIWRVVMRTFYQEKSDRNDKEDADKSLKVLAVALWIPMLILIPFLVVFAILRLVVYDE